MRQTEATGHLKCSLRRSQQRHLLYAWRYGSGFCLPLWHNGSVEDAKSRQEGSLSDSCHKGSDLSDLPLLLPDDQDPTNSVTFFPGVLELEPGAASAEPFPVSVIATQVRNGSVMVMIMVMVVAIIMVMIMVMVMLCLWIWLWPWL